MVVSCGLAVLMLAGCHESRQERLATDAKTNARYIQDTIESCAVSSRSATTTAETQSEPPDPGCPDPPSPPTSVERAVQDARAMTRWTQCMTKHLNGTPVDTGGRAAKACERYLPPGFDDAEDGAPVDVIVG